MSNFINCEIEFKVILNSVYQLINIWIKLPKNILIKINYLSLYCIEIQRVKYFSISNKL